MKTRIKYAWHVLMGRPIAYRLEFKGGALLLDDKHIIIAENTSL